MAVPVAPGGALLRDSAVAAVILRAVGVLLVAPPRIWVETGREPAKKQALQ